MIEDFVALGKIVIGAAILIIGLFAVIGAAIGAAIGAGLWMARTLGGL